MSDIVERLRFLTSLDDPKNGGPYGGPAAQQCMLSMREAADTITALREELSIWKSVFPDIAPERVLPDRSKLEAEVERLRAALRNAYEVYAGSDGFIPETAAEGYQQQIIKQMVDCISAALGEHHE